MAVASTTRCAGDQRGATLEDGAHVVRSLHGRQLAEFHRVRRGPCHALREIEQPRATPSCRPAATQSQYCFSASLK